MQIHELDTYIGTPSDTDFMAVDDGTETFKIPLPSIGVTTEMTVAEAEEGSETAPRVISPAVLNTYVSNATETADHVIETGTSGYWTYRKWESGIAECWMLWSGTLSHYWSGGSFYGYSTGVVDFPSGLFIATPSITADGAIGTAFYLGSTIMASATGVNVASLTTVSGAQSCSYNVHAMGKWK